MANLLPSSKTSLLPALKADNRYLVNLHLATFKERDIVRYDKTLRIPSSERLPALTHTKEGYDYIYTLLVATLKKVFTNLNLKKSFNEDQLLDLVEAIIEQSHEDNLSLEDVLLFVDELIKGKRGKLYDRIDQALFFERFETYREERHLAMHYIQYEIDSNYKAMGDQTRTSEQIDEGYQQAWKNHMINQYAKEQPIQQVSKA